MTAHYALRALSHFTQKFPRGACGRAASTSCSGPLPPPPCVPCPPAPRPACRARPARSVRALRVSCCPPPAGQRPPCAPRRPADSITCDHLLSKNTSVRCCDTERVDSESVAMNCVCEDRVQCGTEQDRVARRLEMAKAMRRCDYEREAAACRPRGGAVPRAPLYLGGERECARATDGRDYSVPCAPPAPRPCAPPRCVELLPDDACRVRSGARRDPCAHLPRTLLQIDRSPAPAPATAPAPACAPNTTAPVKHHSSTASKLKSRITQTFSRKCQPPPGCTGPLTSKCQDNSPCGRRNLHLSTRSLSNVCSRSTTAASSENKRADSIETMLRERNALKEAGRGRAVCGAAAKDGKGSGSGVGAQLELGVPHGARRVRVHVALDGTGATCAGGADGTGAAGGAGTAGGSGRACSHTVAMTAARDSWFSMKRLQNKISGYTCVDDAVSKRKGDNCDRKQGSPSPNPCGRPRPPQPPAAKPCARPPAPPAPPAPSTPAPAPCAPRSPAPAKRDKVKPLCRYTPLTLATAPLP